MKLIGVLPLLTMGAAHASTVTVDTAVSIPGIGGLRPVASLGGAHAVSLLCHHDHYEQYLLQDKHLTIYYTMMSLLG